MEISEEDYKRLFKVYKTFKASGMKAPSSEEFQALAAQLVSGEPFKTQTHWKGGGQGGMAPMPTATPASGQETKPGIPIAGFQGNTTFNNQAGTSPPMSPPLDAGQRTADPGGFESLDPSGLPSDLAGGLTPPPPETTGGLSKLPSGKGKTTVETDEKGRVTKITQILTPGLGGLQSVG